jgi:acyl-coenzyme A synthetase/AMP-(fatty) acid ligase
VPNFVRDELSQRSAEQLALVAIDAHDRRTEWTFGAVLQSSGSLAGALIEAGVSRGSVVLCLLGNRIEYPLAVLACLHIGAALLPCSEQLRSKDLALRLDRARPSAVLCDERNRGALDAAQPDCPVLTIPDAALLAPRAAPPFAELSDLDPAFVLFTSGTSGAPKMVTHGQRYVWGQRLQAEHWLGARAGDVVWSTATPGWSKSARNTFIAPWLGGAVALLQDRRFDPDERLDTIRRERVSVLCMAPTEYRLIAAHSTVEDVGSLRRLVTAGEALGIPALQEWQERTGLSIADGYGQTETGHLAGVRAG